MVDKESRHNCPLCGEIQGSVDRLQAQVNYLQELLTEAEEATGAAEAELHSAEAELAEVLGRPVEAVPRRQLWDQINEWVNWPHEAPSSMCPTTTFAVHQALLDRIQRTLFGRS